MNLNDLQSRLENIPIEIPLIFVTGEGPIGAGYHVTELKLANIVSIDCGAQTESWSETTLQLLDGHGDANMPVGKFRAIVRQSIESVEGLALSPLRVEFSHGNAGLQIFELQGPEISESEVTLTLVPVQARCKPAMRMVGSNAEVGSGCCGESGLDEALNFDAASVKANSVAPVDEGCCGGPAAEGVDACCVKDAEAKASGQPGCGCGHKSTMAETSGLAGEQRACCG